MVGMMNFLTTFTHPDILFDVHQCACFVIDPKSIHEKSIKRIVRYLMGTKDKGLIYWPDSSKGIECYSDYDFSGGWDSNISHY